MEGYLRKFVEKIKFFQTTIYPKRYFMIDFQQAFLNIQTDRIEKNKSKIKVVWFRDILDCYLPKKDVQHQLPENWEHCFYLQTRERMFILCAQAAEDRNMWMSGFRYIIASTVTVQNIMKANNDRIDEKMKIRTKHMQEVGIQQALKEGVKKKMSEAKARSKT